MKKIAVFLAEGFEEVEALVAVDLLRRANIEIDMISISNDLLVKGRSNIEVKAEFLLADKNILSYDGIILPGGMPGTTNLMNNKTLCEKILQLNKDCKLISAICAAPTILASLGIIDEKKACCFPSCEKGFSRVYWQEDPVCIDGNVITSRGAGTAIPFALEIVKYLEGENVVQQVREGIVY